jgi:hypothetical protein
MTTKEERQQDRNILRAMKYLDEAPFPGPDDQVIYVEMTPQNSIPLAHMKAAAEYRRQRRKKKAK